MDHNHSHDFICNGEKIRTTIPMKERGVADLVEDMSKMAFRRPTRHISECLEAHAR